MTMTMTEGDEAARGAIAAALALLRRLPAVELAGKHGEREAGNQDEAHEGKRDAKRQHQPRRAIRVAGTAPLVTLAHRQIAFSPFLARFARARPIGGPRATMPSLPR